MLNRNHSWRVLLFALALGACALALQAAAPGPERPVDVYDPGAGPMKLNLAQGIEDYKRYAAQGPEDSSGPVVYRDYGIYKNRDTKVRVVELPGGVLTIKCLMPPQKAFDFRWVSIRKQFKVLKDLSKAQGIRVTYRVLSANTQMDSASKDFTWPLRITLCDHKDRAFLRLEGNAYKERARNDTMWWFDIPTHGASFKWTTIDIPFSKFQRPMGGGSRASAAPVLNAANINAYEINVTDAGKALAIEFEVADIVPYAEAI